MRGCASSPTISPMSAPPASSATAPISPRWPIRTCGWPGSRASSETAYATGLNLGTGVAVQSTTRIETQGSLNTTGNAAGPGAGWRRLFPGAAARRPAGLYPRGQFHPLGRRPAGDPQGYAVQPAIPIPEGAAAMTVAADGIVSAALEGQTEASRTGPDHGGQLRQSGGAAGDRRQFPDRNRRQRPGPARRRRAKAGRGNIRQGMLEASNVNVVEELVDMIECQRAYEINSKMVSRGGRNAPATRTRRCEGGDEQRLAPARPASPSAPAPQTAAAGFSRRLPAPPRGARTAPADGAIFNASVGYAPLHYGPARRAGGRSGDGRC